MDLNALQQRAEKRLRKRQQLRQILKLAEGALYSERLTLMELFDGMTIEQLRIAHRASIKALRL